MGPQQQPVSRLSDLIRLFAALLNAIGDGTTIMVGRHYLGEFGVGSGPRILFVPSEDGELGDPAKMGGNLIASYGDACTVYLRAADSSDDVGRLDAVDDLLDRTVNALKWCSVKAEIVRARPKDDSPSDVPAYGADKVLRITWRRDIARIPEIWRVKQTAVSPPDPDRPQGDSGQQFVITAQPSVDRS